MDDDRNDTVSTCLRPLEDAAPPDLWPTILERSLRDGDRARHRRGAKVAAVVAAVGVVAAGGIAAWPDDSGQNTQLVVGSTGTTTAPGDSLPDDSLSDDDASRVVSTTELPLLDRPVALDLLALRPNGSQVAVIDLDDRMVRSSHRGGNFSLGGVSGAAITEAGDALVWINNEIFVFDDADFSRITSIIRPGIGVDESLHLPGIAAEQHVVPTADGSEAWVTLGPRPIVGDDTLVERIDLTSRATTLSTSLVGVDARPIVATRTHLLLAAGGPDETPSVLVMDELGSTANLGPGVPIAAFGERIAVLRPDGDLVTIGVDGTDEVTIDRPEDGSRWNPTGSAPTLGLSPPARRVTSDGRLLMAASSEVDVNGVALAQRLYSVDMVEGTVERIAEVEGAPFATWSRTGDDIVLLQHRTVFVLSVDSPADGPQEVASLPPDTWLFAAG